MVLQTIKEELKKMNMKFNNPAPKTKSELEMMLASSAVNSVTEALVDIALNQQDWQWAQNIFLQFLSSNNHVISGLAATCLGHIARIHHHLDKEKVIPALMNKVNDPVIGGTVQDALDDIEMFL